MTHLLENNLKNISRFALLILTVLISCNALSGEASPLKTLASQDIKWSDLNPARGSSSPRAANLWGDRSGSSATGFLVKFKDEFSSPPHIHNVSYRAIVISGLVHNDNPNAAEMWMKSGSFWTQPAGEVHITSAKGDNCVVYVEIDSGPYLVHSPDSSFESDEKPVNVDESNLVWVDSSDLSWLPKTNKKVKVSFLWGERDGKKLNGTLLKLPPGFVGEIQPSGSEFHAIVVKGKVSIKQNNAEQDEKSLESGSYFDFHSQQNVVISSDSKSENIVYIRTNDQYRIVEKALDWF